ncbi:hypothetical protein AYY19_06845 [Photobacterium aquimaris]|uniref:Uncharacterized protein n=1 Tax=Photobacterium aquimaris TaxID=512643 RepID=A0A2T3IHU0_9GAMM|nr:hypothetical protein AYY19_06845 [Photobacterium aquimaris]OBU20341.1 hypothetical protein AYY20_15780 [Photobacterium aquimaris]PSU27915.1 hypothetical protein CTM88_14525 [Photobacterium aquimaris]PSW01444.1 hypothetical protein CTM91_07185 [Photobacterium aquimaris]
MVNRNKNTCNVFFGGGYYIDIISSVKFKRKQPEMITSSFKAGDVMVTDRDHEDNFGNIVIQ